MTEPEEKDKKQPPRRPVRDWESAVEKQLREAMERGEFDHLEGRGKPLQWEENPYTPPDWRLAYKLLKDAGYAPDWIEADKEIRAERARLYTALERHTRWEQAQQERAARLPQARAADERRRLQEARQTVIRRFRREAGELNRLIDTYNIKAPTTSVHHPRIPIEEELARFEKGLERG